MAKRPTLTLNGVQEPEEEPREDSAFTGESEQVAGILDVLKLVRHLGKRPGGGRKLAEDMGDLPTEAPPDPNVLQGAIQPGQPGTQSGPAPVPRGTSPLPPQREVSAAELWEPDYVSPERTRYGAMNLKNMELDDIGAAVVRRAEELRSNPRVPLSEVERRAKGVKWKDLIGKAKTNQRLDPHELLAARQMLTESANQLVERSRWMVSNREAVTPEMLMQWQNQQNGFVALQQWVGGQISATARTLSAMRIQARKGTADYAPAIGEILRQTGGAETIMGKVALMARAQSPEQAAQTARETKLMTSMRLLQSYYINNLLSGPPTHFVNAGSNLATAAYRSAVVKPLAATYGSMARLGRAARGTAQEQTDDVTWGEIPVELFSAYTGFLDGMRAFSRMFSESEETFGTTAGGKLEYYEEIAPSKLLGENKLGQAADWYWDHVQTLPGKMMQSSDQLFKGVAYRSELQALAMRHAINEGLTGEARYNRVAQIIMEPETVPEIARPIHEQAMRHADYQTFTDHVADKGWLGSIAQSMLDAGHEFPAWRLFMPFIRTPTNLIYYALDHMPGLGFLSKQWRDDLNAGGARRQMALGKATSGAVFTLGLMPLVLDGRITGKEPSDRAMAEALKSTDWKPYSIRFGDKYYPYSRFDPLGTQLGWFATSVQALQQMENPDDALQAMVAMSLGWGNVLTEKTYLAQLGAITDAIGAEDENKGVAAIRQLGAGIATGMVPMSSAVFSAKKALDPGHKEYARQREPSDHIGQYIWKRVLGRQPIYSEDVPNKVNWRGEESFNKGSPTFRALSPIELGYEKDDLPTAELLAHQVYPQQPRSVLPIGSMLKAMEPEEPDIPFRMPSADLSLPFQSEEKEIPEFPGGMGNLDILALDDGKGFVYLQYQKLIGKARYEAVKEEIATERYADTKDHPQGFQQRQWLLKQALSDGAKKGRAKFFQAYNEFADEMGWQKLDPEMVKAHAKAVGLEGGSAEVGALFFRSKPKQEPFMPPHIRELRERESPVAPVEF